MNANSSHVLRVFVTLTGALLLTACSSTTTYTGGEHTPEGRQNWLDCQSRTNCAAALMREKRVEEAADMYESLWRDATDPAPKPGAPPWFFVANDMGMWRTYYPQLAQRWAPLLLEAEARAGAPDATPREIAHFIDLTEAIKDTAPLIRQVEALAGHPERLTAWRESRLHNAQARQLLTTAKRSDLAELIQRTPVQRAGDGVSNLASGAAGLIAAPVLGPGLAPK